MIESTDRVAWTQTITQGRGNGLNAFRHKQNKTFKGGVVTGIQMNYYDKSNGMQFLDDNELTEKENAKHVK